MVSTTPFSSVLHQLLATSKPSSKGKGKAKSQPADFLSSPTPVNNKNWSETVEAFVDLVEKYEKNNISTEGNFLFKKSGIEF